MKKKQTNYLVKQFLTSTIVVLFLLPLSMIVPATDTTPPEISGIQYDGSIFVSAPDHAYIIVSSKVTDNVAIAGDGVRLIVSGPNGFFINESMSNQAYTPFYDYTVSTLPSYGTYRAHIWAIDTSGNSALSKLYHTVILSDFISGSVVVNASNVGGPWWNGTEDAPFQTINEGVTAVSQGGTVFVHNGHYYDEGFSPGRSVSIVGENKDNTIISSSVSEYGVLIQGDAEVSMTNFTISNSPVGIGLVPASNKALSHCIIRGNSEAGIHIEGGSRNMITNCDIRDNAVGINLKGYYSPDYYTGNNIITHNNFINNSNQILISTGGENANTWNDSAIGNYWDTYRILHQNTPIDIATGTWTTPFTIAANNVDFHPSVNPSGSQNHPPGTPDTPTGPTTGYITVPYTYTTNVVTDPDNNQVFYQFSWGDNTTSSWITTSRASHAWTTPGTYPVKVKVKDELDLESQWSSILVMTFTRPPLENQLVIDAPSTVPEGQAFIVTIYGNGTTIANATVTFADETYYSNADGQLTITAPLVNTNIQYQITTQHTGFESAVQTILVLNHDEEQPSQGYIFGTIHDASSGLPLQFVQITMIISESEHKVTFSDAEGRYFIAASAGFYTIQASIQGYTTQTKQNIPVTVNTAIEQNFLLEKTQHPLTETDRSTTVIEYTIQEKATQGKIGAQLNLQQQENTISYYSEEFNITLHPLSKQNVSFTIAAEDNTTGTIIVLKIGPGVLADLDNITLTYDNRTLNETTDLETFFNLQGNTTASWFRILTTNGLFVLIRIPHFSEHTITITSLGKVLKTIGGLITIAVYITVLVVLAVLTAVPILRLWKKIE